MPREIVSVVLSTEDAQRLRTAATQLDRSLSYLARKAIRVALAEYESDEACG